MTLWPYFYTPVTQFKSQNLNNTHIIIWDDSKDEKLKSGDVVIRPNLMITFMHKWQKKKVQVCNNCGFILIHAVTIFLVLVGNIIDEP